MSDDKNCDKARLTVVQTSAKATEFAVGDTITFWGDLDAINAYINAGCPEPEYKSGCPILPESDD